MSDLLTKEEMIQAIWDMGVCLESGGREINQRERFNAIAKAQDAKTKKGLIVAISGNSHMGDKYLHINPQWWESLKKEVEDG